jgi:hypothetical protein
MSRSVPIDHLGKEGFDSKIEVYPRTELVRAVMGGSDQIISDFFMVILLGICSADLYQVLLGQKNTTARE